MSYRIHRHKIRCEKCGFTSKQECYSRVNEKICPNCHSKGKSKLYHSSFKFGKRKTKNPTKIKHNNKMMKLIHGNPINKFGWSWNKYHRPRKVSRYN